MSTVADPLGKLVRTGQLAALTGNRRRRIVRILRTRSSWIAERRLAVRVAAAERDESVDAVPEAAVDAVQATLRHVHLPALTDAGLVERTERGVVAAEALRSNPWIGQLVDADSENWDAVLSGLADGQRQTVLAILEDRDDATSVEALARVMAARDEDSSIAAVRAALHHRHLPKLAAADLIGYDAADGTVTCRGHPDLPPLAALEG
jgi:DNA-binding transcriptional ArsR family regulator